MDCISYNSVTFFTLFPSSIDSSTLLCEMQPSVHLPISIRSFICPRSSGRRPYKCGGGGGGGGGGCFDCWRPRQQHMHYFIPEDVWPDFCNSTNMPIMQAILLTVTSFAWFSSREDWFCLLQDSSSSLYYARVFAFPANYLSSQLVVIMI